MWRRIFKVLMLSRQVAPLLRKFCKGEKLPRILALVFDTPN